MPRYFLFLSFLLHASLLLAMVALSTEGETHPAGWSSGNVILVGLPDMGGTGAANAEKADGGRISSPAPRTSGTARKDSAPAPQEQKSRQAKGPTPGVQSIETKALDNRIAPTRDGTGASSAAGAGGGMSGAEPHGVPLGDNGFGQGRKPGIGNTGAFPVALHQVEPEYPRRARQRNITGKVVISCTVNVDGSVADPVVIESSPKGVFEQCACSALKQWTFRPAFRQGDPVASRITIPFRFEIN